MTPSELANMDNDHCIVVIRGLDPFYLRKLSFLRHPNFKETGDADQSKVIGTKYLDEHFACLPQRTIQKQAARDDEDQNKEDYRKKKQTEKEQGAKKPITSNQGTTEMAKAAGITETNLPKAMEAATEVPPEELKEVQDTPVMPVRAPIMEDGYAMEDPDDSGATTVTTDAKPKKRGAKKARTENKDNAAIEITSPKENRVEEKEGVSGSTMSDIVTNATANKASDSDSNTKTNTPLTEYKPTNGQIGPETDEANNDWGYFNF